ncbi:MAG: nitroreductase family deazaflavin-dependent oxidoreductase [Anaerolineae bacterium]|nr:nitroreductase family deazaflavin-dependent oxidoreductase [Anaerolineae bacterium]
MILRVVLVMGEMRMSDEVFFYLETVGRRSGQPHEVELWFVPHGGCFYMVAEGREQAHWVQNLLQQSSVRFRVGQAALFQPGRARTINPTGNPELAATVAALFEAKYNWSDGLIVEVCPAPQ